jgi:hypothetical protein
MSGVERKAMIKRIGFFLKYLSVFLCNGSCILTDYCLYCYDELKFVFFLLVYSFLFFNLYFLLEAFGVLFILEVLVDDFVAREEGNW